MSELNKLLEVMRPKVINLNSELTRAHSSVLAT
jgi:hypothetical protein